MHDTNIHNTEKKKGEQHRQVLTADTEFVRGGDPCGMKVRNGRPPEK